MRLARLMDEGGRGLYLVGALAARWGTRCTESGETVRVDLPLPARAPGGAAAIETAP